MVWIWKTISSGDAESIVCGVCRAAWSTVECRGVPWSIMECIAYVQYAEYRGDRRVPWSTWSTWSTLAYSGVPWSTVDNADFVGYMDEVEYHRVRWSTWSSEEHVGVWSTWSTQSTRITAEYMEYTEYVEYAEWLGMPGVLWSGVECGGVPWSAVESVESVESLESVELVERLGVTGRDRH